MPLHDWTTLRGWDGLHQVWIVELLYWLKPRLPAGYRAYIGTTPTLAIGAPGPVRPDVVVRDGPKVNALQVAASTTAAQQSSEEPDQKIAVATLEGEKTLFVELQDRLIAAVELVSPRNNDRPAACTAYASVYAGYLLKGVNLLLVDVHRRPLEFSFADRLAEELHYPQPPYPAPFAVSYRVGEPAPSGGTFLAMWRRFLTVKAALPAMQLPLSVRESVLVDLEQTYARAAAAAYLS